jgi:hypothetical protein
VPYADFSDPQSLNQYAYVRNNPLSRADADGHDQAPKFAPAVSWDDLCDANLCNMEQMKETLVAHEERNQPGDVVAKDATGQGSDTDQKQPADQNLTNVVYNEAGSLHADPNAKPGAPGSAEDLANGRQAVAEIANRVIDAGHPDRVAPSALSNKAASAVKNDPNAIDAYGKSRTAADAALNGSNISNSATQYRTRVGTNVTTPVGKSQTNPGTPVSQHYGPFIEGNHTVVIVVAR